MLVKGFRRGTKKDEDKRINTTVMLVLILKLDYMSCLAGLVAY